MDKNLEKFELDTVADFNSGTLTIVGGYDKALETVNEILANPDYQPPVITDKESFKLAKERRALLNNAIKQIDRRRIDAVNDFTIDFTEGCNNLKNKFAEREREFKAAIDQWTESQKTVTAETTTKKFTATIKFTDEKLVKKLTDFCTENNCELTIK